MIQKIEHYSINNPASVYNEEALTALELAGRTAQLVNECADVVNKNEEEVAEAKAYMTEKLPEFVENEIDNMNKSGELDSILATKIANDKVDKNGNGQIKMNMLSQEVKTAMTGGSVAVVGDGAVANNNMVDGAVDHNKLIASLRPVNLYCSNNAGFTLPLIKLDTIAKSCVINSTNTIDYILIGGDGEHYTMKASELTIDASNWDGQSGVELFYNPSNNILAVVPFYYRSEYINNMLYLGGYSKGYTYRQNIIPIEVDGVNVTSNIVAQIDNTDISLLQTELFYPASYNPNTAVFDINSETYEVTIKDSWNLFVFYNQSRTFSMNREGLNTYVNTSGVSNTNVIGVWWNPDTNTLIFDALTQSLLNDYNGCLYLGTITTNSTMIKRCSCILSFTLNDAQYYHKGKEGRIWAKLECLFSNANGTKIKPRVDFVNRKLIIPQCSYVYGMTPSSYYTLNVDTTKDIEVPFPDKAGFCYLVGGASGLMFVNSSEFATNDDVFSKDQVLYFGYLNESTKMFNFTFDCEVARTVSILGDSISTYEGYNPEGQTVFYKGNGYGVAHVNQTWWKRVMNRCGLELNKNNSWGGAKVTMSNPNAVSSGVYRATLLDNGTDPDVILIYLGINDFNSAIGLGTYDGRGVTPTDTTTFREAYAVMLSTISQRYQNAKIYAMTLPACQKTNADVTSPEVNTAGVYLTEYNNAIKEIANAYCVEVIDTACCGINYRNASLYMGDFTSEGKFLHPNAEGHKLIAQKVIKSLLDSAE